MRAGGVALGVLIACVIGVAALSVAGSDLSRNSTAQQQTDR
jgi:hypothetical protein